MRELRPDVLVLDVSMPVMDGAAATEEVAREHPGVKVLILTAHGDRAHLTRLMDLGASGFIVKRAAADELVRAIRIVGEGGTYVDASLMQHLVRRPRALAPAAPHPRARRPRPPPSRLPPSSRPIFRMLTR